MAKILFLQNSILQYRKPLYNQLSIYHDVTVVHSGPKSKNNSDIYTEIVFRKFIFFGIYFLPRLRIFKLINQYDIIISMFDLRWPTFLMPIIFSKKKIILWGHRYGPNSFVNNIRDYLMQKANVNLLYGDECIEKMKERNINLSNVKIAWNTVFVPNSSDTSNNQKTSILFLGRLQPSKKIDQIIYSFHDILEYIPSYFHLEIVGSDADESKGTSEKLKSIVQNLNIGERVIFHGEVTDHDVLKIIFSRSLVNFSPCPLGLSILHSFAYGVPLITLSNEYHGPEFTNIVDGYNSIVCDTLEDAKEVLIKFCNSEYNINYGHFAFNKYTKERNFEGFIKSFLDSIEFAQNI